MGSTPPLIIVILVILLLSAGCSGTGDRISGTRTVIDASGASVNVPDRVERVVSLAPSETEIVVTLGAKDRLVGRTDYCDYPPGIESIPSVGGPKTFSVEKVVSLSPDLILTTTIADSTKVADLRKLGYAVVLFDPNTVEDIYANIGQIGRLLDVETRATELVADLQAVESHITSHLDQGERLPVMYVVWDEPLYIAGNTTFEHDLIIRAGGKNVMDDLNGYMVVSDESVVERAPEVIIVCREHTGGLTPIRQRLMSRPGFAQVPAISAGRICEVDPDLANRPGPRVMKALESFVACIHA